MYVRFSFLMQTCIHAKYCLLFLWFQKICIVLHCSESSFYIETLNFKSLCNRTFQREFYYHSTRKSWMVIAWFSVKCGASLHVLLTVDILDWLTADDYDCISLMPCRICFFFVTSLTQCKVFLQSPYRFLWSWKLTMRTVPQYNLTKMYKSAYSWLSIVCQQSKSYTCSSQGNVLCFTIDFGSGFTCSEGSSKVKYHWVHHSSCHSGSALFPLCTWLPCSVDL